MNFALSLSFSLWVAMLPKWWRPPDGITWLPDIPISLLRRSRFWPAPSLSSHERDHAFTVDDAYSHLSFVQLMASFSHVNFWTPFVSSRLVCLFVVLCIVFMLFPFSRLLYVWMMPKMQRTSKQASNISLLTKNKSPVLLFIGQHWNLVYN